MLAEDRKIAVKCEVSQEKLRSEELDLIALVIAEWIKKVWLENGTRSNKSNP